MLRQLNETQQHGLAAGTDLPPQRLPIGADQIPDFRRLSDVLINRTGWQVVAVPGSCPTKCSSSLWPTAASLPATSSASRSSTFIHTGKRTGMVTGADGDKVLLAADLLNASAIKRARRRCSRP